MLDFETCMTLKDAGFPQGDNDFDRVYVNAYGLPKTFTRLKTITSGTKIACRCPSTNDLLAELKPHLRNFFFLTKISSWIAYGPRCKESGEKNPCVYGKTPELALANLYLMLHKKGDDRV